MQKNIRNVSNVSDMSNMFDYALSFNQDISCWNISNKTVTYNIFDDCPIQEGYKPKRCR